MRSSSSSMVGNDDYATTSRHIAKVQDDFSFSVCSLRKRKKEKGQSKGGMGGRHAACSVPCPVLCEGGRGAILKFLC